MKGTHTLITGYFHPERERTEVEVNVEIAPFHRRRATEISILCRDLAEGIRGLSERTLEGCVLRNVDVVPVFLAADIG